LVKRIERRKKIKCRKMKINTTNHSFEVELYSTPTTQELIKTLPLSAKAILWGKEIYFSIPINCELEDNARDILMEGEIAYYPPLNAFCIFFGPTPVSTDSRPKAADLVNVLGRIKSDYIALEEVLNGETITLTID
jgi:hypothetical protein